MLSKGSLNCDLIAPIFFLSVRQQTGRGSVYKSGHLPHSVGSVDCRRFSDGGAVGRRRNQDGARGILGARGSVGARGMDPKKELPRLVGPALDWRSRVLGGVLRSRVLRAGGGGGAFGGDRASRVTSVAKSSLTSIGPIGPPLSSGRKGLVNRTEGRAASPVAPLCSSSIKPSIRGKTPCAGMSSAAPKRTGCAVRPSNDDVRSARTSAGD